MDEQISEKSELAGERCHSPTVFISYSHEDEEWKNRLVAQLKVLEYQGLLTLWDDRLIQTGQEWELKIINAIDRASIAVLLVSANFLKSKFIGDKEVPQLLQRRISHGLCILPVIIKPCDWEAVEWLKPLNLWPTDGMPLSAGDDHQIELCLTNLVKEIRILVSPEVNYPRAAKVIAPDSENTPTIPSSFTDNQPEKLAAPLASPTRIIFEKELDTLQAPPYTPPVSASTDGCLKFPHRISSLLQMNLVSFDRLSERFGIGEIVFAFFFGLLLCGINIWQRYKLLGDNRAPDVMKHFWDAVNLNLAMGSSIFFLTAEILVYLNHESVKISLFIQDVTRRLVFAYLFALCGIEVISHLDSVIKNGLALLIVGQVIFFTTNAIEAFIDLKVAVCFRIIGYHYKKQEDVYSRSGKWAIRILFANIIVSVGAVMASMTHWQEVKEEYIILGNFLINLATLLITRWQISNIKED